MKEYFLDNTGEVTFTMDEPIRQPLSDQRIAELMFECVKEKDSDMKNIAYRFARAIEREHGIV
jgi:hypothetical protein